MTSDRAVTEDQDPFLAEAIRLLVAAGKAGTPLGSLDLTINGRHYDVIALITSFPVLRLAVNKTKNSLDSLRNETRRNYPEEWVKLRELDDECLSRKVIKNLQSDLRQGTYRFGEAHTVEIPKAKYNGGIDPEVLQRDWKNYRLAGPSKPAPGGKTRTLTIDTTLNRIVATAVNWALDHYLYGRWMPQLVGFRRGLCSSRILGTAIHVIETENRSVLLACDLRAYYDRVRLPALLTYLQSNVLGEADSRLLDLIQACMGGPDQVGLPQGSPISPLLANVWAQSQLVAPLRHLAPMMQYADDMLFMCRTVDEAISLLRHVEDQAKRVDLELAEEKTQIVDLRSARSFDHSGTEIPYQAITYLGVQLGMSDRKVTTSVPNQAIRHLFEVLRDRWFEPGGPHEHDIERLANQLRATDSCLHGWLQYFGPHLNTQGEWNALNTILDLAGRNLGNLFKTLDHILAATLRRTGEDPGRCEQDLIEVLLKALGVVDPTRRQCNREFLAKRIERINTSIGDSRKRFQDAKLRPIALSWSEEGYLRVVHRSSEPEPLSPEQTGNMCGLDFDGMPLPCGSDIAYVKKGDKKRRNTPYAQNRGATWVPCQAEDLKDPRVQTDNYDEDAENSEQQLALQSKEPRASDRSAETKTRNRTGGITVPTDAVSTGEAAEAGACDKRTMAEGIIAVHMGGHVASVTEEQAALNWTVLSQTYARTPDGNGETYSRGAQQSGRNGNAIRRAQYAGEAQVGFRCGLAARLRNYYPRKFLGHATHFGLMASGADPP